MTELIYVVADGQTEPLIHYNSLDIELDTKGSLTATLNSLRHPDNYAHKLVKEEAIIVIDDYNFRVKQVKENLYGTTVQLLSTFYDLIGVQRKEIYAGSRSLSQWLIYIFGNTGWTATADFDEVRTVPNFGKGNVIELAEALSTIFECEYEIRRNNVVHFSKRLASNVDNEKIYWYGMNVRALDKEVDTTQLRTYIEGYGADNVFASYTSPYINTFGRIEANPIEDDEYLDSASLREYLITQLNDVPEMWFELDSIELLNTVLGENVWLIYEPLNIELQTRILKQNLTIVNDQLVVYKVVLGNKIPYNTNDRIIDTMKDLNETKQRFRSRFEQTDNRITLEVEEIGASIGTLTVQADEISQRVSNNAGEIGALTVRANSIEANVSNANGQIASLQIQANSIQSQVTNNANNSQSQINQLSNSIQLKVDVGGTIRDINVNNQGVTINSDKINLNGAVVANGSITGSSTINVGTDLYVGRNIYMQGGGGGEIRFPGADATLYANGSGYAGVRAYNGFFFDTYEVDFSAVSRLIGVAGSGTSGLSIAYSATSKRLYVRINGTEVGYAEIK